MISGGLLIEDEDVQLSRKVRLSTATTGVEVEELVFLTTSSCNESVPLVFDESGNEKSCCSEDTSCLNQDTITLANTFSDCEVSGIYTGADGATPIEITKGKLSTREKSRVVCSKMMTSIKRSVKMLVSCVKPRASVETDEIAEACATSNQRWSGTSDLLLEQERVEVEEIVEDDIQEELIYPVQLHSPSSSPITSVTPEMPMCPMEYYRQRIRRFVLDFKFSGPLLPDISIHDLGKKCLVLDLDETLIHSQFQRVPFPDLEVPIQFEDNNIKPIYVCKRPGVDEFLEFVGKYFEVVIFTASLASYADPVINFLDRTGTIRHRLYRDSCVFAEGLYLKDLSRLGRPLDQIILIDNAATSYLLQPENGVLIRSWFSDLEDTELLGRLKPALEDLPRNPDVYTWKKSWCECITH